MYHSYKTKEVFAHNLVSRAMHYNKVHSISSNQAEALTKYLMNKYSKSELCEFYDNGVNLVELRKYIVV